MITITLPTLCAILPPCMSKRVYTDLVQAGEVISYRGGIAHKVELPV